MGLSAERRRRSSSSEMSQSRRDQIERGVHQRERLFLAVLAGAQSLDGGFVARVDDQLESADALEREDLPVADYLCGREQGVVARERIVAPGIPQLELRAATRAGVGLGVEPAVERVVVFALALRAHREFLHRSVRAVVGQRFDDGEARAAVRAVGEGISMAAIGGIENFPGAIGAGRDVGQDEDGLGAGVVALADFEAGVAGGIEEGELEALDDGARRLFGFEARREIRGRCRRRLRPR